MIINKFAKHGLETVSLWYDQVMYLINSLMKLEYKCKGNFNLHCELYYATKNYKKKTITLDNRYYFKYLHNILKHLVMI